MTRTKQITMDWQTYQEELMGAEHRGFTRAQKLATKFIEAWRQADKETARKYLNELLDAEYTEATKPGHMELLYMAFGIHDAL